MRKSEIVITLIILITILVIVNLVNSGSKSNMILVQDNSYKIKDNSDKAEDNYAKIIEELHETYQNKDIVAELSIDNTSLKTPILQTINNDYYYRRLPNKQYSIIGSTFMDYRTIIDKSRILIIYGHNSTKYNMPFKILENYYNYDYLQDHQYINLLTSNGVRVYQVFSVYVETSDFSYYYKINFNNDKEFYKHIKNLQDKSFYDIDVSLKENDNILILQACSTMKKYQNFKKKFVLIISKEIK